MRFSSLSLAIHIKKKIRILIQTWFVSVFCNNIHVLVVSLSTCDSSSIQVAKNRISFEKQMKEWNEKENWGTSNKHQLCYLFIGVHDFL